MKNVGNTDRRTVAFHRDTTPPSPCQDPNIAALMWLTLTSTWEVSEWDGPRWEQSKLM